MAEHVYGGKGVLFWITQLATFAILILAANTAYHGFPGLSSIIARDGYLPRQLANRGDKLVFSNGILFLAVAAGVLVAVFGGNISALIPLYAFGVFTGFTLSQAGHGHAPPARARAEMEAVAGDQRSRRASRPERWPWWSSCPSSREGAWIPAVIIPALVVAFRAVSRHYATVRGAVTVEPRVQGAAPHPPRRRARRLRASWRARGGRSTRGRLAPERLIAVSVVTDHDEQDRLLRRVGRSSTSRSRCTRSPRRTGS